MLLSTPREKLYNKPAQPHCNFTLSKQRMTSLFEVRLRHLVLSEGRGRPSRHAGRVCSPLLPPAEKQRGVEAPERR